MRRAHLIINVDNHCFRERGEEWTMTMTMTMTTRRISISWLLLLLLTVPWSAAAAAAAAAEVEEQVCRPDEESCDATKLLRTDKDNLAASSACVNEDDRCDYWASAGECETNPRYMHVFCPKSCRTCNEQ